MSIEKVLEVIIDEFKQIVQTTIESEISNLKEILNDHTNGYNREWLTRKEKAEKENISISMVDKLVRQGKFEKKKIGRKTLIRS